jgi:hypothetical protein
MSSFDEREKGYERKFQQEQELAFKVRARRNKLFGLWAAERMGLTGAAAETYANELVAAGLEHHGDTEISDAVTKDFADKGVGIDATRVQLELEHCAAEARKQYGAPR